MTGIHAEPRPVSALKDVAGIDAGVVLLGLEAVDDSAWEILAASGLRLLCAADESDAVRTLTDGGAEVVLADVTRAPGLIRSVRAEPDLAAAHVVVCAEAGRLRAALDAGADDVMRIPFEPEVLAARVAAGLRAARLRANEALLHSLVANIPGAVYRCVCDEDWTMLWLSDEIETISGYAASDFIASRVRTFTSVIHPDDREQVERSVMDGVAADRPFTIEYRIVRSDGEVRWVLERGQAQEAGDGRRWLDGAIFDVTARRAAEQALREQEIVEAKLAEVQASRARILEAADRGAAPDLRADVADALDELRTGLAELRDLAHGLHPAVLTDRGLEHALVALSRRAPVPVELTTALPERLPIAVESAAYFTVCEALTNVAKYADASHAWVTVERRNAHLAVEIGDDGVGGVDMSVGSGLEGLRDRIAAVDGTLEITSPARKGTILRAHLPVPASVRPAPGGAAAGGR